MRLQHRHAHILGLGDKPVTARLFFQIKDFPAQNNSAGMKQVRLSVLINNQNPVPVLIPAADGFSILNNQAFDAEAIELGRVDDQLQRERLEVERAMATLNASSGPDAVAVVMSRRDAYNERAVSSTRRAQQHQRDREALDSEIARYNLMVAYPDGMDDEPLAPTGSGEPGSG